MSVLTQKKMGIISTINKFTTGNPKLTPEDHKLIAKLQEEWAYQDEKAEKKANRLIDQLEPVKKTKLIQSALDHTNKFTFARTFIENIPLYYDNAGIWWVWIDKKKCWEIKDEVDILNFVKNITFYNITKSHERTEILNALKQYARENKPEEAKKTWVQFNDEVIDLTTGHRFEAKPKYFVTNPIPFDMGRTENTPTMDKIFKEWVGKDYVNTLYEVIAYCCLPDYPLHRIFCFMGDGMNGKSCFLGLLKKFLGGDNVCSTELDALLKSRFEITRLHKKLACIMGETNFDEISQTSMLKKLSGGDLIGFEYKHKNPFDDVNYAKIIIATNNLPATTDKTPGFYRRWMIIDFPNKFSEKAEILKTIPDKEYENLATKCVRLLMKIIDTREFHKEGTIEERIERYESKSDFLEKFMDLFVDMENPNAFITKADFYKKFISWCNENKLRRLSQNSVGKKLKAVGVDSQVKTFSWMNDGRGGTARCWIGIGWRDD